jgi:peroxiredoxin
MRTPFVGFGLLALPLTLAAQEPVRAGLMGTPRPGSEAPDFTLPYFTVAGPGPADQPFRRSAELGRKLVLVFGTTRDTTWWRAVAAAADSAWPGAFAVGVVRASAAEVERVATGLPSDRLKLLADPENEAGRKYGVGRKGESAFVIADDGRVLLVRGSFSPSDRGGVGAIARALSGVSSGGV